MLEENEHTGAYYFVAYLELAKINSQEDPKQVEISFTSLGNVHSGKITEHGFNGCKIFLYGDSFPMYMALIELTSLTLVLPQCWYNHGPSIPITPRGYHLLVY